MDKNHKDEIYSWENATVIIHKDQKNEFWGLSEKELKEDDSK